jgi:hypothetical protein
LSRQGVGRVTATSAQQTSWASVHEYVEPLLAAVQTWPLLGSPAWCALPDNDARKIAAVYDGARHWALRLETCQAARAEASRDVSAAADWTAIGREIRNRSTCYIRREAS